MLFREYSSAEGIYFVQKKRIVDHCYFLCVELCAIFVCLKQPLNHAPMEDSALFGTTDSLLVLGAIVCLVIAFLIFIYHEIRASMVKNAKEKYDYVTTHEIRHFWYSVIAFIASAALYLNKIVGHLLPVDPELLIYVRMLFFAAFSVVAYLLLAGIVRILYPRVIERRLKRIRNKPRISPAGNVMRKLKEEEESVHLEQSEIDEQASQIHSAEYDVWIDEKTGFKQVEKYMGYQHSEKCGECGFYTMKIHSEEITRKPAVSEEGLLVKHYRCSYCKHREAREVVIAQLSSNK